MSSLMDGEVEKEPSWKRFPGGAVGSRRVSAHGLSPRGSCLGLEDVVVNTTAAPVRFRCRTLSG